jgi:hypothetical protein
MGTKCRAVMPTSARKAVYSATILSNAACE